LLALKPSLAGEGLGEEKKTVCNSNFSSPRFLQQERAFKSDFKFSTLNDDIVKIND